MTAHDDKEWLTVKFMHRGSYSSESDSAWIRQFPKREPTWGTCRFTFDPEARNYDWLVVYHDLPPTRGETPEATVEELACPRENTMHVTYEPSSITTYGHAYLLQYKHLLTSQEPNCIRHPGMIHSQPGFPWFYGRSTGGGEHVGYDELVAMSVPRKEKLFSTVCSTKRQKHTAHRLRHAFTERLKKEFPKLETFGLGVRPIEDKAEALTDYKYHFAMENHFAPHHWTEKLADPFLGFALPFYAGCPNAKDYFPEDSFVPIDPRDLERSLETIRRVIENDEYEKRLPAIREARRMVLEKYNLFAVLSREIERLHQTKREPGNFRILCRKALWKKKPLARLHCLAEKTLRMAKGYFRR
tara:strand:+ start:220 stop:1290 length:1071 start_codon:yes stop_codon:yes gene_type:complete